MKPQYLRAALGVALLSAVSAAPSLSGEPESRATPGKAGKMCLVLAEFDGKHDSGRWDIHHYGRPDGKFRYGVRPSALVMFDKENRNQHLTRRGFLLDPKSQYAVEACFKTKKSDRNPNSFCLNFQIAGDDGTFEPTCCWSINVSIEPDKGPGPKRGGLSFNMGFLDDRFKRVGKVPVQKWCAFDTEYKLRVDVNTDGKGKHKLKSVAVTVTQGEKVVHRRVADYSDHAYQPDFSKPVRVGVNSHGGNWTMRNFKVYCDRRPILGGNWPTEGNTRAAPAEAGVRFARVTIDRNPPARPYYKMLGDVDGDGLLDIVIAGAGGPLVWYKYPGWVKTEIASGGWQGVKGQLGDVDSDGDADIVMGGTVWFRNPRIGRGRWRMIRIDAQKAHDVELGDLDRDGRLDVVGRDQSAFGGAGNVIYVYRQENPESWEKHTIACPHGEGLKLADLDRDGDLDIVIAARWYENTGRLDRWTEHRYTTAWTKPDAKVEVADFDRDGRLDVVLTPAELRGQRYRIAWYEAPERPTKGSWKEHVIVPDIEAVIHSLAVGDFDLDGDVDVAVAEMHQGEDPDEVTLQLNLGGGTKWRKHVLSNDGSHDLVAGDMGGDGDLDIVGANHAGPLHPVELWRNELKSK